MYFATLKIQVPLIDPESRQPVGADVKTFRRGFADDATLADVRAWAMGYGGLDCTLMFESPEDKG